MGLRDEFVPPGFKPLEWAVTRLAAELDPEIWAIAPEDEKKLYGKLGSELHWKDLQRSKRDHDQGQAEVPYRRSYERARAELRRALYAGHLLAVVRSPGGELHPVPPVNWGGDNAPNWFDDGECFVATGGVIRRQFGPYLPGLPDELNFIEEPEGFFAPIFIPDAHLEQAPLNAALTALGSSLDPFGRSVPQEVHETSASVTAEPETQSNGSAPEQHPVAASARGQKTKGIQMAVTALWPDGIPEAGLPPTVRDARIAKWLDDRNLSVPDARTFRRHFNKK